MVIRKNLKKKFALISVYDKRKLSYLCTNLKQYDYNFISSGSTGENIREMGFECTDISKITKSKEMFDGRIKTINPLIYSSLLYVRNNSAHIKQFLSLKIPEIDIVIVNLYPFEKYFKKNKNTNIIEMIDIGGPSLLRASGKNFQDVTPIMKIEDYPHLIRNLKKNNGMTDIVFRKKMANKIFKETSKYDQIISSWFSDYKK
jgi:phosphoribosylaminoimidazolecarboxamide formyltransferase/IMP cyclohydrolase